MKFMEFFRARIVDPITSHMAAESVADVTKGHMEVICACLKKYGPMGKDGIAKYSGLRNDQVWRRLPELQKMGLIELTGKTARSNSGRSEREWRVC
jgi:predicted ArsR family transcriptional regulator